MATDPKQKRQLNIRVPDDVWLAIRQDALTNNVSVESLCSTIFRGYMSQKKSEREMVLTAARKREARKGVA